MRGKRYDVIGQSLTDSAEGADFLSPAALGIPKGDACYRRDARNEGNERNGHTDDTDGTDFYSPTEMKEIKEMGTQMTQMAQIF